MRALVQRAGSAAVSVEGRETGRIGRGLLVLLGVEAADDASDAGWLAGKVARLRIFQDDEGRMNRSVLDEGGAVLVVSQFTLHASTARGNRPSFERAARPEQAVPLYEAFLAALEKETGRKPACGVFGASMRVELVNEGPVTIMIDSRVRE